MDLSTTYMGFKLDNPLVPGASPMVDDLDTVKKLEDAGAPMLVMHSLFEEQIVAEQVGTARVMDAAGESYAEALSYFPKPDEFRLGPEAYLTQIGKIKKTVRIPVIASLNGTTPGGWLKYAKLIQQAGADGLELNLYELATDPAVAGAAIEKRALDIVREVRGSVTIPLAVKLSPFYSSIANFASELDNLKVSGLVLFNRFYQPDIDVEALEVKRVNLSTSSELLLRLRWIAALSGRLNAALACTGGVHTALDAIKAVMAGAHSVQMVAALLTQGPGYLKKVRQQMDQWMQEHEYESLQQMQGSMSMLRCPDPRMYERANYVQILNSWQA